MKKYFLCLIIFLIMFVCNLSIQAQKEDTLIFSVTDSVGDDYGPGTYQYPQNQVFAPYEGLFDIIGFSIKEVEDKYLFTFNFKKITDPWQSHFGFSHPLIHLYIDNAEGGSTELIREGSNVRLDPNYPWNISLQITGWWVRVFREVVIEEQGIDIREDITQNPNDVKDVIVEVDNNDILVYLEKELIGSLAKANIFILVGSFDPFGPNYYRSIENRTSTWNFADLSNENLRYAPRVIDLILPENMDQIEVLSNFQDDYPMIYPIKIGDGIALDDNYILLAILLTLIILISIFIFKKYYMKNKK